MTEAEFNSQIQRLITEFGKAAYSPERAVLIWREVQQYSSPWFTRTCDRFIGEWKQAPRLPDFREAVSQERDRLWVEEKRRERSQAMEIVHSVFEPGDVRFMVQMVIRRMAGSLSDEAWTKFLGSLEFTIDQGRKE